ncbi:natural cytotoxicity triggering receptor 3 ligand 1 [Molossus molossus]|uniref:Ig-like domain-containing protein n=1 Tax=Molossus molossus TaxID=27622 RepID=A0A7J8ESK3_MOLMO|nr:natural cytotoxicity triggering receptor 3 ligand 1 [Molossus molossus]KAF6438022.1 hypothetical protein HJG59_008715 [Molossus molossus]
MTMSTEAAAGTDILRGFLMLQLILWCWVPPADFFIVEMAGKTQTVLLNATATIYCKVPGSQRHNIRTMAITWFRKHQVNGAEDKVFEFYGSHQKAFRQGASVSPQSLEMGDGSLKLPGVQLREAGEYRCEMVITPEKAQGTVYLEVVASPISRLFQEDAVVKDHDIIIVCESSGFYPEDISITLCQWTWENSQYMNCSEAITSRKAIKNEDGTFNITNRWRLKQSQVHSGTICQCVIRHVSLPTSQKLNFTLSGIGSETGNCLWIIIISIIFCFGVIV